jgi:predicted transcriptional regulator
MKSYIEKQTKLVRERVEAKLEQSLMQKLEQYCEYLDSDRDYVISQALAIDFEKDKGFGEWLRSQAASSAGQEAEGAQSSTRKGKDA